MLVGRNEARDAQGEAHVCKSSGPGNPETPISLKEYTLNHIRDANINSAIFLTSGILESLGI